MTHSQTVFAGSLAPVFTLSLTLLGSTLLTGCSGDDSNLIITPDTSLALQGNWERSGYGTFLSVAGNDLSVFEATSATCHLQDSGRMEEFIGGFSVVQFHDDELRLSDSTLGIPSTFNRKGALPVVCDDPISNLATEQFDHVWHTFNDYYAFFSERSVDWLGQYDQWRPMLRAQSSEEELAATKATRTYFSEGASQSLVIRPSERRNYTKPIILIASGFSVSAAEVFTLLMRSLPHVTHLGEPTNGALSNEIYRDVDGNAFEVIGIPPYPPTWATTGTGH